MATRVARVVVGAWLVASCGGVPPAELHTAPDGGGTSQHGGGGVPVDAGVLTNAGSASAAPGEVPVAADAATADEGGGAGSSTPAGVASEPQPSVCADPYSTTQYGCCTTVSGVCRCAQAPDGGCIDDVLCYCPAQTVCQSTSSVVVCHR